MKINTLQIQLLIVAIGAALFLPNLGAVHLFDWDEINFAESAREMILTGDFSRVQINYEPFWEKPPLFFWLQVLSMKIFGVNEYAARFPNAVTGIITLLLLFNIGEKIYNRRFGLLWVLMYIGSFLPHFYFKSGIIDPVFNLFIFMGIYKLYRAFEEEDTKMKYRNFVYAGIFIGLAVLTKGPVALLVSISCTLIFILLKKKWIMVNLTGVGLFLLASSLTAGIWFGLETIYHGPWFIQTFIDYNIRLFLTGDSGHGQPIYYHPIVLLLGCFPASIFCIMALGRNKSEKEAFVSWMQILFWVVLLIFSATKTKIVHYSSLCYFPVTFLAAYTITQLEYHKKQLNSFIKVGIAIIGTFSALIIIVLPFVIKYKAQIVPYIKDRFAVANLNAVVNWTGFEFLIGILLLACIIGGLFYSASPVKSVVIILSGVAITLQLVLYIIVPKIERYTQGAMIDFFKSVEKEDCYVKALGFKSYAQYFYTNRKPGYNKLAENEEWLLYNQIDKPAYLITKCDRNQYKEIPHLTMILEKNGFIVYKLMP